MKIKLITLLTALLMLLPTLGLAAETTASAPETPALTEGQPEASEASEAQAPSTDWLPGRGQRRWQNPGQQQFQDENQDGLCDLCGKEQGQNPQAPGFTDENKDGVCDHLGTETQYQGRRAQQSGRFGTSRSQGKNRGQGMMGRGQGQNPVQGQTQGPRFEDANGDGVCDFFNGTNQQRGPGRNRR